MSLYTDDDPTQALSIADDQPALHAPTDPQQALNAALALDAESSEQQEGLLAATQRFEQNPEKLPELIPRLLALITDGGDSLLRFWTLDMIALTVGRSGLRLDIKLHVAQYCLNALNTLLNSGSIPTIKAVIPILATIYPMLFRLLATSQPSQEVLDLFNITKARVISLALDPKAQPDNVGIKAVAWKYIQRVLLAATRATGSDPRLSQRGAGSNDVNIAHITVNGSLNSSDIEKEGSLLQTQLVTQLYTASNPAILHPLINALPTFAKMRPSLSSLIVHSLASWTPSALVAVGRPAMEIRAVDKTVRLAMSHLLRHNSTSSHNVQLKDALDRQKTRMEAAFVGEAAARKERRLAMKHTVDVSETGFDPESSEQATKRAKLIGGIGSGTGKGPEIDVSQMELEDVVESVISSLRSVNYESITSALQNAQKALRENAPDMQPLLATILGVDVEDEDDEDEVLDPLGLDDEDEDLLMLEGLEPMMNEEEPTTFAEFSLPAPEPLETSEKEQILSQALERIWQTGADLASLPDPKESDAIKTAVKPKELWMLLLARLVTRGAESKRKAICDFVTADFVNRSKFASVWLNEEWYNERIGVSAPGQYIANVDAIISSYLPNADPKDKSLAAFILTLPSIPPSLITTLESVCQEPERALAGFVILRDIVETRPPIRPQALQTLLELCTHPERKIRVMAIITIVRRWGQESPMMPHLIHFALGVLRRLVKQDVQTEDVDMEEGEQVEEKVESKFLGEPNTENVQQHVELAFALAKRQQRLLDDIFRLYPKLEPELKDAVEAQLMPLIQSLGASDKLLEILRHFPQGSDKLVMRVIGVLSAEGAGGKLAGLMKDLLGERELDARFVVPIVGELDAADIKKQLPNIVTLLGDSTAKDMVKTAFASILQKMTPADLMVALHQEGAPLKLTIEAIGICFSMTQVFRGDVLANAMSQIAKLPTIPLMFVRTLIQVVATYKSVSSFVANHILPPLITKKIWEIPQLWDGFIMLAKRIAPASCGALLQLPKEQLKEVLEKQPGLKTHLKEFLANKPGNKAAMVEIFGEA
ncbi:hypothetical protein L204_103093 [Cryptococcus depauperatus]|nr:symplekin [Cryptococcus depauperatus CBS 7855]